MDTINQYAVDSGFPEGDQRKLYSSDRSGSFDEHHDNGEGWKVMDVTLNGGAPWGFTLRGGLEHGEPLLITKVEGGSKAATAKLQAGDELVNVNNISLNGYRQEAICLIKSSHKTLSLIVKRKMKMVDIVAQKMPSESDVHMARSFLTKILRSSMRKNRFKGRNEPMSRPHSWHATKFNESHSEAKKQSTPSPVWQTRNDASSFFSEVPAGWEQTNLRRVSDQFSSLGSMDSLEHSSHPGPSGHLSPSKSNNNSSEHLGGKRDSAYSSFSTSSGTPDYTLSKINAASTENMLYKINQWDSSGRHSNGRHNQSQSLSDGVRQDERLGYLQHVTGSVSHEVPKAEEQPGTRHSSSGRVSIGPVWHVPDMKKNTVCSTPPPTPPARSDSFAATKVHEKGLITSSSEGLGVNAQLKPQVKALQKAGETHESMQRSHQVNETGLEGRHDYNLPSKNCSSNPYISSDAHHLCPHHMSSDKTYSLSTIDVRDRHQSYAYVPYHPRQYSDEGTFHAQTRIIPALKPPFSGYFSSMQELSTNNHMQINSQNQIRRPAASLSSHVGVTSHRIAQGMSQAPLVRVDDSKASSVSEMSLSVRDRMSTGSQGRTKDSYFPPQSQHHETNHTDNNATFKQIDICHRNFSVPNNPFNIPDSEKPSELRGSQRQHHLSSSNEHSGSYPPSKQPEHRRSAVNLNLKEYSQQPFPTKSESKICPQKTPMLYSLAQEHNDVEDCQDEVNSGNAQQEALDSQSGKQSRRSDQFATTLRNEIQMRRDQLQKRQSSATLESPVEAVEDPAVWKTTGTSSSSSDGCFSSSYKDHLKEAQARVLQATSFRRKDLEPVLFEHPGTEGPTRKDTPSLPGVSEVPGSNQVLRIGNRKRFSAERKVRSFSEPDKIHEVGANERSSGHENAVPLENRYRLFEAARKPAFPKPIPKQNLQITEDTKHSKSGGMHYSAKSDTAGQRNRESLTPIEHHLNEGQVGPHSVNRQAILEQQRLGTFAEYEAKWKIQRKAAEPRVSGRYHSADNILDTGNERQSNPTSVHERSRSSPSADFYGQKLPVQEKKSADYSKPETKLCDRDKNSARFHEKGYSELVCKEKPEEPPLALTEDLEKNTSDPPSCHHKTALHFSDHSTRSEPASSRNKNSVLLPHLEKYKCPEGTPPPLSKFQEVQPGSQGGVLASLSPINNQSSAPLSASVPWKGSENSKGSTREEELQEELVPPPFPPPPPPAVLPTQQTAGRTQPSMEGQRSPSPQFAPQRLTDKPPVSVSIQDEAPGRMDRVKDENMSVKKVPIKIVHFESDTEKESRQYLDLSAETPVSSQGPGGTPLQSLGNPDQSYSLFCTYTRQKDQGPGLREADMGPLKDQGPQTNMNPESYSLHGLQTIPLSDQSSNGVSSHPSQSDDDKKTKELARDIMDKDKSLVDILDQSKMKTTMDLMEGIFPEGEQLLEEAQQRRKAAPKPLSPRNSVEKKEEDSLMAATTLVTNSTYYSTSAPKAELLNKMKDMQEQSVEHDSEEELEEDNESDLASRKQELIDSLSKKLQVLKEAQESLQEDVQDNNALGEEVEAIVQGVCKPNELEKFRMFVGDLDKVVNLLLSLSGRLARVENALNSLEEDASLEERRTLTEKRKLLIRQHEDAKELKENLDRRERVVYDILASYLSEENMADYEHFVKMKSALIIEQRKLEDKIKLGEEQLKCLMDSLPMDQRISN
ncbi:protein Shroom2 isoform X1 [Carassius auratus]|uniref:Protein Shroom2-like isoform X1 n=3 Tax=Carassius auratus TaxID=7957 RepID=A0A6P6KAT7_CARAU|nr:protein Shroom2-like isoform X1 [Carassius auratus]XP_026069459.1 protein Shroom2-like isoform X1 [Carassius auratus]